MSLAVNPVNIDKLISLAKKRDVEATVIGEFQDTGLIDIRYKEKPAGLLSIDFLHDGLPAMELKAEWKRPFTGSDPIKENYNNNKMLHDLLNEPNIASKESLVRQYDHEVGGVSIVKPFTGANSDAPSDGAVLRPVYDSTKGVTVTHGICPRYSDKDAYDMAMCAVDEAYRAHIGSGGNPEFAAVLDNFCWPDPVESEHTPDGKYKLAQLVRACKGLNKACIDYGLPLISGKDSMKNDTQIGGHKVSVRPTLLVSLMGIIEDTRKAVTTDFKKAGDDIYILGNTNGELGGTFFEKISKGCFGGSPEVNTDTALSTYNRLSESIQKNLVASCHDLSDGGIAIALAESTLGGMTGSEISIDSLPGTSTDENPRILFCESPSRFIISIKPENSSEFEKIMSGSPFKKIGKTTDSGNMIIKKNDAVIIETSIDSISKSWKREDF
jgi:phosphoribosylformylglycinamidine synthase